MGTSSKVTKGHIKTDNVILIIFVSLAVGFIGGVFFSAFRSSSNISMTKERSGSEQVAQITPEQKSRLEALVKAAEATPDNVNVLTKLGHLYFDTKQYDKAIAAYEKSLALDGNRPDVWTDLGVMYRRAHNPDKAIESFERAITLNQSHEPAFFNKGVVLMHDKNDPIAALQAWEQVLKINPNAKTPAGTPVKTMVEEIKKQHF